MAVWHDARPPVLFRNMSRVGARIGGTRLLEHALEIPSLATGVGTRDDVVRAALQQLGEIYAARGERAKATEERTR